MTITRRAALAFPLLASPLLAMGASPVRLTVRRGFADWQADAPGERHWIRAQDLPPPFATRAAFASPTLVPAGHRLPQVMAGWHIAQMAAGLGQPRTLHPAPGGGMLLAESGRGRIALLRDGAVSTVLSGLDLPYGMALWPPGPAPRFLYVGASNRVLRAPLAPGTAHVTGPATTVVPHLPEGGHWTRDIAFSPDGARLYVAVGSRGNIAPGAEPGRAQIRLYDPEGGNGQVFAQGLRNPASLAVRPDGTLWAAVNERDELGDNLPPDYVARVSQGDHFGWPWFYTGANPDPRVHNPPPGLRDHVRMPDVLIQPHSAPIGMAVYPPDGPLAAWRGSLLVALHGSWDRARRTGYKLVRIPIEKGTAPGWYEDVLTGFVASDDAVWGRPTGVAVDADGAIWMSEDAHGTIWRLTPSS